MTKKQILAIRVATAKLLGYRTVTANSRWFRPGEVAYVISPNDSLVRNIHSSGLAVICRSLDSEGVRVHIKNNYGIDLP